MKSFQQLCVARAFLGIAEGGTMPVLLSSSFNYSSRADGPGNGILRKLLLQAQRASLSSRTPCVGWFARRSFRWIFGSGLDVSALEPRVLDARS